MATEIIKQQIHVQRIYGIKRTAFSLLPSGSSKSLYFECTKTTRASAAKLPRAGNRNMLTLFEYYLANIYILAHKMIEQVDGQYLRVQ